MRTMATLERSTAACSGRTKDGDQADHEHRHIRDVSSSSTTRRNEARVEEEEEVKVNIEHKGSSRCIHPTKSTVHVNSKQLVYCKTYHYMFI